ncbi:G2/mitotic-specific cyclin-B3 [Neocloeon triangulifer]|uniref:G2/mitotic-specific cyclin-B3 n=1 Tax=Neocloeon triangulifer TaxID=2078957 RepID=UPI00286EC2A2|nr:G2/mitotic-specific cyclin-B3 [Neocloeon triangulifer]
MLPFGRRRVGEAPLNPPLKISSRNSTSAHLPGLFDSENMQPSTDKKYNLRAMDHPGRDEVALRISKRKSAFSPSQLPHGPVLKRSAFSDVTNAIQRLHIPGGSKKTADGKDKRSTLAKYKSLKVAVVKQQPPTITEEGTVYEDVQNGTLYMSALDDLEIKVQSQPEIEAVQVKVPTRASSAPPVSIKESELFLSASENDRSLVPHIPTPGTPPLGVLDYDQETSKDTYSVPDYAPYIFSYLKSREDFYKVKPNFLDQHREISNDIRALVVDWMVEVQETLELNHETLYLAVKNMDLYLSNPKPPSKQHPTPSLPIKRNRLRLIACASLLLAAQYDERLPPPTSDWLQMCDNDFSASELSKMQQQLFCALNFNLGAPLSYRFLRRYSRACSLDMDLLTLARYILEASLMDSQFSSESDSMIAAAALWLATCMVQAPYDKAAQAALWTKPLQHYSGYKLDDFRDLSARLNTWIKGLPKDHMKTVHAKYSHRVFRKVALIPALEEL